MNDTALSQWAKRSKYEEQRDQRDDAEHAPSAAGGNRPVAPGAPVLAFRLNHDAGPLVGNRDVALYSHTHRAPDLGVAGSPQMAAGHVAPERAHLLDGAALDLLRQRLVRSE